MPVYTDIAAEFYPKTEKSIPDGVHISRSSCFGIGVTRVKITKSGLTRPEGIYITMDMPDFSRIDDRSETCIRAVARQLRELIPQKGAVLVAGIGNRRVSADALGPCTADRIFVTRHLCENAPDGIALRSVAAFSPGVLGETGFSAAELIQSAVRRFAPCAVIAVDSLCTSDVRRLGCSVQISTSGLFPREAGAVTQKTLGVPVIALGIPTLMEAGSTGHPLCVVPRDIDAVIRRGASLLSLCINKALQSALSAEELAFLTS